MRTPPEIKKIIKLFSQKKLSYVLFKCEHIFDGQNKNLDILFETNHDYQKASTLLKKEGYVLFLPEKLEKFKEMYVKFDNVVTAIHLHRKIAWHGVEAIKKKSVFRDSRALDSHIIVPSLEDQLLIHATHVLFENFAISERERKYVNFVKINKEIDWKKEFNSFKRSFITGKRIPKRAILNCYIKRTGLREALYLFTKFMRLILRKLNLRRRGTLISLIGVNGAGKSTITSEVVRELGPLMKFLHIKAHKKYFGWQPFTPWAKMLSKKMKKKKVFKSRVEDKEVKGFSLFQEGLFLYNFVEYLFRYWINIYPKLRKGHVVITDRYFYDLYGQYPYATRSVVINLLMLLFPKPDKTFVLDAPTQELLHREKEGEERKIKSVSYLESQRRRYLSLGYPVINTGCGLYDSVKEIVNKSWKKIIWKQKN